jgi:glyoxylase-like metal-dependent hydrolase (beta-lactamase superfamily II)
MPSLRTFVVKHTTCVVLECPGGDLFAFEAAWPGSLPEYRRALKAAGGDFGRVRWVAVSHFHMDHAGLLGEFQALGIQCLLLDVQAAADIAAMEALCRRNVPSYRPVDASRLVALSCAASRAWFAARGVPAKLLHTPGHSPDSVSLLCDGGDAFVGDLAPPDQLMPEDLVARGDWERLKRSGARRAFCAHAGTIPLA